MTIDQSLFQQLSVVVPVFNEEANVLALYERLAPVMDKIGLAW